jgi:hypothetical protein
MPLYPVPTPGRTASVMRTARVSASLGALFLAACGGSVSTEAPAPAPVQPTTVTLSTQVLDATGTNPVSGATVVVATSAGSTTLALNDGRYSASIAVNQFAANVPVVITISKPGFLTETIQIPAADIVAGRTVSINTPVTLDVVPVTTLIAADGIALTRLGNGETTDVGLQSGQIFGTRKTLQLGTFGSLDLTQYASLTLSINFRGLDVNRQGCADKVAVYQTTNTDGTRTAAPDLATFTPTSTPALTDSPDSNETAAALLAMPVSGLVAANGPIYVEISSGACKRPDGSQIDAFDDFEFFDVRATFDPVTPV